MSPNMQEVIMDTPPEQSNGRNNIAEQVHHETELLYIAQESVSGSISALKNSLADPFRYNTLARELKRYQITGGKTSMIV